MKFVRFHKWLVQKTQPKRKITKRMSYKINIFINESFQSNQNKRKRLFKNICHFLQQLNCSVCFFTQIVLSVVKTKNFRKTRIHSWETTWHNKEELVLTIDSCEWQKKIVYLPPELKIWKSSSLGSQTCWFVERVQVFFILLFSMYNKFSFFFCLTSALKPQTFFTLLLIMDF